MDGGRALESESADGRPYSKTNRPYLRTLTEKPGGFEAAMQVGYNSIHEPHSSRRYRRDTDSCCRI